MNRRTFLTTNTAVGAGLAGCLGRQSGSPPTETDPTTASDTVAQRETPVPDSSVVEVDSLEALAEMTDEDDTHVRLQPGKYELRDYLTEDRIQQHREDRQWAYMDFSGSNTVFDLTGVTIYVDTKIREELSPDRHSPEFKITGTDTVLRGATIVNVGHGTSPGGNLLSALGERNRVEGVTLEVRGSAPYGYGDLLGKGGLNIYGSLQKHSGLRVTGDGTRVVDTNIFMDSFGHGFYIQSAAGVVFRNCYVEGKMRPTDAMLEETSGPAYERDFDSVFENREGEKKIAPGYMKSLAEDGFRGYGAIDPTFVNCVAKNMRAGWEFRRGECQMFDCRSIGTERGIWVGPNSRVRGCRADIKYGPALLAEGNNISVDMEIAPITSEYTVNASAIIGVRNHTIRIGKQSGAEHRFDDVSGPPIKMGFDPPLHGESMSPITVAGTIEDWGWVAPPVKNLHLENETPFPVDVSEIVSESTIATNAAVTGETEGITRLDPHSPQLLEDNL